MDFKNKKITVMGLGLYKEGSGISATRFLLSRGAKVTVTDLKTKAELIDQIKRLGKLANQVRFVLGKHRESDFKNVDMIIKNPAIPRKSKYLEIARANNIPIETDISLFFKLVNRRQIIGITGTRGKSTVTTLIYEILKQAKDNVIIGGNITKSPLVQLNKMKKNGLAILELSSWLLESLEDAKLSPRIAVFTNIYPDHLNTYKDIDDYAAAKENIFKWQINQDYVVLNLDNEFTKKMGSRVPSKRFWFSLKEFKNENGCFLKNKNIYFRNNGHEEKVLSVADIKMPGSHNIANVLAAVCVCKLYGLKSENIKKVVSVFYGVPNRLELLREIKDVKYYNDTTSTMPEASLVALQALKSSKKNIILIAGGADKGLDFTELVKEIEKTVKSLVLFKGTGTDRILKLLKTKKIDCAVANSMSEAIGLAKSFSKTGDIILLSPACASFGMFKNEFDRGDQFRSLVDKLK
ncbi:UDP-N-acetylmuramoyl-L-alanine--D-glutamate ligase [Candidatus Falkowbacteria bacterium]|uniref:UDP-N-acetylmuramoylalanine--D-glutamate ligase n=1 Tax=Candidatus Buchananbacteria bacterium CG10_big_fil_rev_8_21_14_0_10_33_19 TaxID=1974525 RepID=A0A2H0W4C2_9BACT|nr:UDP-N-acetylmuramoyl-L-alanine--D-glutamate ligase [Candidatus Falkowbacteria bacterium]PIS06164.1 MAG: UDP-N-acetylmuramoyl-L-alanine--D-glutamate ligase [Candidatus Buchananbacteria bacterium CG10_big_fil_rev_8_21_14_0_10_33_19]